jgi:hypothetical protein
MMKKTDITDMMWIGTVLLIGFCVLLYIGIEIISSATRTGYDAALEFHGNIGSEEEGGPPGDESTLIPCLVYQELFKGGMIALVGVMGIPLSLHWLFILFLKLKKDSGVNINP